MAIRKVYFTYNSSGEAADGRLRALTEIGNRNSSFYQVTGCLPHPEKEEEFILVFEGPNHHPHDFPYLTDMRSIMGVTKANEAWLEGIKIWPRAQGAAA
jgi:hypothetical protein